MMPTAIVPNQLDLSYLKFLTDVQVAQQKAVVKARKYYDGEHTVFLTERLKEFLHADELDVTFRLNIYRVVIEAVIERLIITSIDCGDQKLKEWAAAVFAANHLDIQADDVHEMAVRDGQAFVIVDWDVENKRARFTPHPLWTDSSAGDTVLGGFGCDMVYPDNDPSQPPKYAIKRWVESLGAGLPQQRATFYYPDRIEKLVYGATGWVATQDPTDASWPLPWVGQDSRPLGIPVIHFKNRGLRCEGWDAIPPQDALNKTLIDLLAAADTTAFRILVALGFMPTSDGKDLKADGSNALRVRPGGFIGTPKKPGEASVDAIEAADLTQLRELVKDWITDAAIVTNTPVSRFQITGQVAAEGTLKEQEEPLLAKVRSRQKLFGSAWESCFSIARRLQNTFGAGGLNEEPAFSVQWADAQTRTDKERQDEWKVKKEMGIPRRQLWSEMGYPPEKVQEMLDDPEVQNSTFTSYP